MTELSAIELAQRAMREPLEQRRATLMQAIAAADSDQDTDLGYRMRMRYISASHNAPDSLNMIASFGWCVARHDEDPERFPLQLWYYKWVVNAARGFAGVSRTQLEELLNDMDTRFQAAGASPSAVAKERMGAAWWLGDVDQLPALFDTWRNSDRKGRVRMNDCAACDLASEAKILQLLGRFDEALEVAQPLINHEQGCSTEPHYTLAAMLQSYRSTGREEDKKLGEIASAEGLNLISDDPDYVLANGDHLRHFAATGQLDKAMALLRRTAHQAVGADSDRLSYSRGARMVLQLARARDTAGLDELAPQFDGVAEQIVARFDTRNGNSTVSNILVHDDDELSKVL